MGWVFTRLPDGDLALDISANEREVLQSLPGQLAEVLRESPDQPALVRLAPPAYTEDADHEAEYRHYMGDDLRRRQLAALAVMSESAGATRLSPEQAEGWLSALNSLRLVLGTQLDVGEDVDDELHQLDGYDDPDDSGDPDDPDGAGAGAGGAGDERGQALNLYRYLSMLLQELVEAMSEGLPDVPDEPGAA
ncbi:MAG TPA: DUF2017 family protein [Acidimicrobiales bacterium]|nr:DUF2017 family protein [Acidimicrobiales bacterium]